MVINLHGLRLADWNIVDIARFLPENYAIFIRLQLRQEPVAATELGKFVAKHHQKNEQASHADRFRKGCSELESSFTVCIHSSVDSAEREAGPERFHEPAPARRLVLLYKHIQLIFVNLLPHL